MRCLLPLGLMMKRKSLISSALSASSFVSAIADKSLRPEQALCRHSQKVQTSCSIVLLIRCAVFDARFDARFWPVSRDQRMLLREPNELATSMRRRMSGRKSCRQLRPLSARDATAGRSGSDLNRPMRTTSAVDRSICMVMVLDEGQSQHWLKQAESTRVTHADVSVGLCSVTSPSSTWSSSLEHTHFEELGRQP